MVLPFQHCTLFSKPKCPSRREESIQCLCSVFFYARCTRLIAVAASPRVTATACGASSFVINKDMCRMIFRSAPWVVCAILGVSRSVCVSSSFFRVVMSSGTVEFVRFIRQKRFLLLCIYNVAKQRINLSISKSHISL